MKATGFEAQTGCLEVLTGIDGEQLCNQSAKHGRTEKSKIYEPHIDRLSYCEEHLFKRFLFYLVAGIHASIFHCLSNPSPSATGLSTYIP